MYGALLEQLFWPICEHAHVYLCAGMMCVGEKGLKKTRECIGGETGEKEIQKERMTSLSLGSWTISTDLVRH